MRRFLFLTILTSITFSGFAAHAANRTICFNLKLRDVTRWECPVPGTFGVPRPCRPVSEFADMVGFEVQLWDKDSGAGSADDYIGTWHIDAPGAQCATFAWENASYWEGEADPDVYIVLTNGATKTLSNGLCRADIRTSSSVEYASIWSRNGPPEAPDLQVAVNCTPAQPCWIYPQGTIVPNHDNATNHSQALLAIDSAQRFLQTYCDQMDTGTVWINFPDSACPTGCASSRSLIRLPGTPNSNATNGRLVTHEFGHVLQMQLFEQDFLRDDLSNGDPGWVMEAQEWESGATTEGWAAYTSAVSWYDPGLAGTAPVYAGMNIETPAPIHSTCGTNGWYPVQTAKAFWDLDDVGNEGAVAPATVADSTNFTTLAISSHWDQFADGTANNQDREENTSPDRNAVNVKDFGVPFLGVSWSALLDHNCLQFQATD